MNLSDLRGHFAVTNVKAFYAVVRERESSNSTDAYTLVNFAAPDDDVRRVRGHHFYGGFADHPYAGLSTRAGGYAAGAPQFIPSTWAEVAGLYHFPDFSPQYQDLGYVARVVYRGALDDVIAGRFEDAVAKCRKEWTSLPGAAESSGSWTMEKAREVFIRYGGALATVRLPRPGVPTGTPLPVPPKQETRMGALALFAPILAQLIPQIASILKPESDVAKRNVALGETIANTIVQAAGATNLQDAVEKMQGPDGPAVIETVKKAIVTEPTVMSALQIVEVGGGAKGAADRDLAAQQSTQPFWKTSAVFWVSMILLPMVYWYVGSSVVGGVDVPSDWPWYAQMMLKMFGQEWSLDARSGLANLIVGLVLGGICGVYFGISVTQQKQQTPPSKEA